MKKYDQNQKVDFKNIKNRQKPKDRFHGKVENLIHMIKVNNLYSHVTYTEIHNQIVCGCFFYKMTIFLAGYDAGNCGTLL